MTTLFPVHTGWKLRELRAHTNHDALLMSKFRLVLLDTHENRYALYETLVDTVIKGQKVKIIAATGLSKNEMNGVLDCGDFIDVESKMISKIDEIIASHNLNIYVFLAETDPLLPSGEYTCIEWYIQDDHTHRTTDNPTGVVTDLAVHYANETQNSARFAESS